MQIKPQQIGLTALPLTDVARLVMAAGATMPTLPLDLLAQVLLQLQRQSALAATEPFSNALEVVRAHR